MLQGKCDDDGLASTTGPLLRTAVDLGMHGVVHQATGCVVKVEMEALVADMDALMPVSYTHLTLPTNREV